MEMVDDKIVLKHHTKVNMMTDRFGFFYLLDFSDPAAKALFKWLELRPGKAL